MALTALPMSTISYNSQDFLLMKLDELHQAGKLDDFRAIKHFGEDGDKDHFHVIVFPSKRLDFTAVSSEFKEADMSKPGKLLGVMPWRRSEPDHWLMYALHDEDYLRAHQKNDEASHKIRYQLSDIFTPFPELLERDYRKALPLKNTDSQLILQCLEKGMSATEIMYSYDISPMKVNAVVSAWHQGHKAYNAQLHQKAYDRRNTTKAIDLTRDGMEIPEGVNDDENPFVDDVEGQFRLHGGHGIV